MATVLVMGFGPFLDITDNPASHLAREIDGMSRGALQFVGRIMPVSFVRAVAVTRAAIAEVQPVAVVGIGVARRRSQVTVEGIGVNHADGVTPDVDGACPARLEEGGPERVPVTLPTEDLAARIGAVVGSDAGRYVCNAWIYQMLRGGSPELPIGFIHIPPAGLSASRLADALAESRGIPNGTQLEAHR